MTYDTEPRPRHYAAAILSAETREDAEAAWQRVPARFADWVADYVVHGRVMALLRARSRSAREYRRALLAATPAALALEVEGQFLRIWQRRQARTETEDPCRTTSA